MKLKRYIRIESLSIIIIRIIPSFITFCLTKSSFGRYQALFQFIECEILLEAFQIWNSVILSFQCEINGGIRIALNRTKMMSKLMISDDWV